MKIKDIPSEDRPYERCLREGPQGLSDAELLSVIIRTGSKEANSMELASRILELNYPRDGILGLMHLSLAELTSIKGIGTVKGIQLLCVGELSRRIWKRKVLAEPLTFQNPKQIADYYQEDMRHKEQEEFHVMFFNTKQVLIREILLSKGTVNAVVAAPREVLVEALRNQAVNMILVHNHPSGSPEPIYAMKYTTQKASQTASVKDFASGIAILDRCRLRRKRVIKSDNPMDCQTSGNF